MEKTEPEMIAQHLLNIVALIIANTLANNQPIPHVIA